MMLALLSAILIAVSHPPSAVNSVAFDPTGRRWPLPDKTSNHRLELSRNARRAPVARHSAAVTSVAFAPDGKNYRLGEQGQINKAWNAATGQLSQHSLVIPTRCADRLLT